MRKNALSQGYFDTKYLFGWIDTETKVQIY